MILALETSTPRASLALLEKGEIVWQSDFTTRRSHNSKIFEPVAKALEIAGEKIQLIVVGTGPGSYSGVRVGISVANGLGFARGIPVIGISSLAAYPAEKCTVVGDARRKTFSVAEIEDRQLIAEPNLIDEEKFTSAIPELQSPIFTPDSHVAETFESITLEFPTAENLAKIASCLSADAIETLSKKPLEPHYLRPPFITVAKKKPQPLRKKS